MINHKRRVKLLSALMFLVLTFALLEIGARLLAALLAGLLSPVQSEFIFQRSTENGSVVPDPHRVIPVLPNARLRWKSRDFDVEVVTNSSGLREPFEVRDDNVAIAFFGDSFTFGHGVDVSSRYTSIVAEALRLPRQQQVVSYSLINGFQPEHYAYFFAHRRNLRPQWAVVGLYLGNDFGADIEETVWGDGQVTPQLPFRRILPGGQMGLNPDIYRWPFSTLVNYSEFVRLLIKVVGKTHWRRHLFTDVSVVPNEPNPIRIELGQFDVDNSRTMRGVRTLNAEINRRGGRLLVMVIPQNYFFSETRPHIHPSLANHLKSVREGPNLKKAVVESCSRLSLNCVDPSTVLTADDYFIHDGHWTAAGHHKIGRWLADKLASPAYGATAAPGPVSASR